MRFYPTATKNGRKLLQHTENHYGKMCRNNYYGSPGDIRFFALHVLDTKRHIEITLMYSMSIHAPVL